MHPALLVGLAATTAAAGHVSIPFSRQKFSHPLAHVKRDDEPFALEALNNITGGGYYSEFAVGTPPQNISFLLDTGSSDTWVNSVEANLCNSQSQQETMGFCQTQFDPEESDTFELLDRGGFDITYLDTRNIQGDYFEDTVTIGDMEIKEQQLGLALRSVRPTGIMGLGFNINVAADRPYRTIVDNMVEQGFIESAAYSLYLNDLENDAGNILFGGIDQNKFVGDLAILPLIREATSGSRAITSFNVKIEGFDLLDPEGNRAVDLTDLKSGAILDSGSTISLLPDDQVQTLWEELGVLTFRGVIAPFIDCAYAGEKGRGYIFEFRFDGKTIRVPIDEMVINAYADVQRMLRTEPSFSDWESICMFGIGSTGDFGIDTDQFTLLGATFLRSAYVVYDLANEQLAIAQANLNSTDSDIVEITSGKLPDVTGVDRASANDGLNGAGDDDDDAAAGIAPPAMLVLTALGLLGSLMVAL